MRWAHLHSRQQLVRCYNASGPRRGLCYKPMLRLQGLWEHQLPHAWQETRSRERPHGLFGLQTSSGWRNKLPEECQKRQANWERQTGGTWPRSQTSTSRFQGWSTVLPCPQGPQTRPVCPMRISHSSNHPTQERPLAEELTGRSSQPQHLECRRHPCIYSKQIHEPPEKVLVVNLWIFLNNWNLNEGALTICMKNVTKTHSPSCLIWRWVA